MTQTTEPNPTTRDRSSSEEKRQSRVSSAWDKLWYAGTFYELREDYVNDKIPKLDKCPDLDARRKVALDYAAQEYSDHRNAARRMRGLYFAFQSLTIVAAATATVLNVAVHESDKWLAAIPAAVATLAAAALAAFRFERDGVNHRRAAAQLKSERWGFVSGCGAYSGHRPDATKNQISEAIDRFFLRVDGVAREADEDAQQEPARGVTPQAERSDLPGPRWIHRLARSAGAE
jgi:Protein of unknown function (DUF4231)